MVDGKFRPASVTNAVRTAYEIPAIVDKLGFDWMKVDLNWNTVTIRGEAPDAESKRTGFAAAKAVILTHPNARAGAIAQIDDRITVSRDQNTQDVSPLSQAIESLGYDWLTVEARPKIATLSGVAPTRAIKEDAYLAAQQVIASDRALLDEVYVLVDAISVSGGEPSFGSIVSELPLQPTSGQCQSAFQQVILDRKVEFALNQASLRPDSERLLDAATAIALLCKDYELEIGVHTDARGSDGYNLILSQERADSIKTYLINHGVSPSNLTATGYGETQPLDPAMTNQAYQKNRRTEFNIVER